MKPLYLQSWLSALKNAKTGLFEVITNDRDRDPRSLKAVNKRIWLPSGQTLSLLYR